ncbi:hypothetical protein MnTg04_01332 [bacterium MnTg04]|nr:hypothetical protein MnTg04_01332 [bacterium MnTg04]
MTAVSTMPSKGTVILERISGAAIRQTLRCSFWSVSFTGIQVSRGGRSIAGSAQCEADLSAMIQKALTPVSSLPIVSWCTVSVPS